MSTTSFTTSKWWIVYVTRKPRHQKRGSKTLIHWLTRITGILSMKLSAVRLIATIQPFTFNATESRTLV